MRSCRLSKTGGEAQQALGSPASSDDGAAGHIPCQMSAKPQVTSGNSMGMLPAADGMVAPTCAPPAQGCQQPQNMPAGSPADADAQPGSQRLDAAAAPAAGVLPVIQLEQESRAEPTAKRTRLQQQTAPTTRMRSAASTTAAPALASNTAAAAAAPAPAAVPVGMASGGLAQVPLAMHVSLPVEAAARPELSAVAATVQPHRPSTPVQLPQLSPRRQSERNHVQKAAAAEAKLQQLERRQHKPAAGKAKLQRRDHMQQHTPVSGSLTQHSSAAPSAPPVRQAARPATLRQVSPPAAAAPQPTGASKDPPASPAARGKSRPEEQAVLKAIADARTLDQLPSRPTKEHLRVIYYQKRKQLLQEAVAAGPAAVSNKSARKRPAGTVSTPAAAAAPAGFRDSPARTATPLPASAPRRRQHVRDPVVAELTDKERTLAAAQPARARQLRSAGKADGGISTPAKAQTVPPGSGTGAAAADTAVTLPSPSVPPATAVRVEPASRRHVQAQGAAPAGPQPVAVPPADAKRSPAVKGVATPQPKRYGTRAATPRGKTLAARQPQPAAQVVIPTHCCCTALAKKAVTH